MAPELNYPTTEDALREELKTLTAENHRLARELRVTKSFLEKISRTVEAKDMFGNAMSVAAAKQKVYTDMLLDNCPNIILLIDSDEHFVLGTRQFLTLCGIHNFSLIDRDTYKDVLSGYLTDSALERLCGSVESVMGSEERTEMTEWIDFGGEGNTRSYSIELIGVGEKAAAGVNHGVLAVFTDITDLARERDRAEAANSAKSDFLATMSHEIRTPMNAILGMSEIVSRSELNPTQKKYISDIQKSAQSLLSIINDILDFSKIEAGKLEILSADYNLRQLLDNLHSMFSLMFAGKSLPISFDAAEDLPAFAYGDEKRLRQVLTNLLSNALKYTHEGHVEFAAWLEAGFLVFDIKDTGIGIREEDREKLFVPFEQLDARRNRNIVGTGLGLAISNRLCQLMDGELALVSRYGVGSTFTVRVPYIPAREEAAQDSEADLQEFSSPSAKVLVVDDIDVNLTVAEAMLGAFDIEPTLCDSGERAIGLVQKEQYDIVFMDQMMPGMDGVEATHRIRALGGWSAEVPIVALTANAINGVEEMFMQNSFDGYLTKPLELAALSKCLRRFLPSDIVEISE